MTLTRSLAILFCLFSIPCAHAQKAKSIEQKEVSDWYNKKFDCPQDRPLYFYSFDKFDFQGSGSDQAIIVAMSCDGGTGGPDIHSVVARDSDGELEELAIPDADSKTYDNLFGNRNYRLTAEKGLLIATFADDPGRGNPPLTIKYKWNGKQFVIVGIEKTGIYPASFDCHAQTLTEVENAICHVDSLAALDVQLNILYKSLLAKLPGPEQHALRKQQREWLAAREKTCPIYKGWVGCLASNYQKRIAELEKLRTAPAS